MTPPAAAPVRRWIAPLALAALTLATWANAVPNGFVWDDTHIIVDNPATRGVGGVGALLLSPDVVKPYYRPVSRASYLLDYQLFGMSAWGFHAVGVAIHLANVLLLYRLARRVLPRRRGPALVAAALLAVHPVAAESVSFISARNNLLALSFTLLSANVLVDGLSRGLAWRGPLAAACWFLALLSKESAATAAGVLAALAAFPPAASPYPRARRVALTLVPALAFAALYAVMRRAALGDVVGAGLGVGGLARAARLNYQIVPRYAGVLAFPSDLSLFRTVPEEGMLAAPGLLLAWAAIVALVVLAVRRGGYAARLGLAWLALAYVPVSNLVPIPSAALAERYLYLPAVGVWLVAGAAVAPLLERWRRWTGAAVAACVLALAARTVVRNRDWRDEQTLFASVDPASPEGHFNLGVALRERGDLEGAGREWEATLARNPAHAGAMVQLGTLAGTRGDLATAERWFRAALRVEPGHPMANFNLARLLDRTGRRAEAFEAYGRFLAAPGSEYEEYVPLARQRRAALAGGGAGAPPPGR